jgi:hypothetical protein
MGAACRPGSHMWWMALYWNHISSMGAACPVWEPHTLDGRKMAPYGSPMCYMMVMLKPYMGGAGATCSLWEPHALDESHMRGVNQVYTLRTKCVSHMGVFSIWEPCGGKREVDGVPQESHVSYGSHVSCAGAIWCHLEAL